jgi:hypothetical protein
LIGLDKSRADSISAIVVIQVPFWKFADDQNRYFTANWIMRGFAMVEEIKPNEGFRLAGPVGVAV